MKLAKNFCFPLLFLLSTAACGGEGLAPLPEIQSEEQVDVALSELIDDYNLSAITKDPQDPAKVALGRALFFDKELSGNRDVSCATCHHPSLASGDELSLPVGVGGQAVPGLELQQALGVDRVLGVGHGFIPRNAPEVFNRGHEEWTTMFWDGRISGTTHSGFLNPAGENLPEGLDSILAAQAMFPVTSRDEMRGHIDDVDVDGSRNELADVEDANLPAIWSGLMARLNNIPEYKVLFRNAYFPELADADLDNLDLTVLGFEKAANAIAAFEIDAFTLTDSPWDRRLSGDAEAMTFQQKRGALLFYGKADCASCHSGNLFTDQQHHNIASPQVGPGKEGLDLPFVDLGRFRETRIAKDKYAFRTPPLRNVAQTGPWFHSGAYTSLEAVVAHHLNPRESLVNYDSTQLSAAMISASDFDFDQEDQDELLLTLAPALSDPIVLSDAEFSDLVAFLHALTDPRVLNMEDVIPETVPSGSVVERVRQPVE